MHISIIGIQKSVITHYGCVTTDQLRDHSLTWIISDSPQSQNNYIMVEAILDSISKTVRKNITNQEDSITVGSRSVRSRKSILKLIMNKTIINTKVISSAFQLDLINLDTFMKSCN